MDLVAFLLFPILGVVTFVRLLSAKNKERRIRVASTTFGIPFLVFFLDELAGQAYLKLHCSLEGGLYHTESVSAEGFLEAGEQHGCWYKCIDALTRQHFKYYEQNVKTGHGGMYTRHDGLHQFYLTEKTSGQCAEDLDNARYSNYDFNRHVPEGKCVTYKRLQQPESRYEVAISQNSPVRPFEKVPAPTWSYPARFYKEFSYIKDRHTGTMIATYTSFWWWGGWLRNSSFGHNSATVCPAIGSGSSDIREFINP